jgi:excisionase family DNA binding protein
MDTYSSNRDDGLTVTHEHRLLNKDEVAELLHTTPRHVERLAELGELSHYRVGRFYRFELGDVQDYLDRIHVLAEAGA